MTEIIELDRRVFECTITPDTPGYRGRRLRVEQLSGEPLTDRQWRRLVRRLKRDLERGGGKLLRYGFGRGEPPCAT